MMEGDGGTVVGAPACVAFLYQVVDGAAPPSAGLLEGLGGLMMRGGQQGRCTPGQHACMPVVVAPRRDAAWFKCKTTTAHTHEEGIETRLAVHRPGLQGTPATAPPQDTHKQYCGQMFWEEVPILSLCASPSNPSTHPS